ncbi:MAG TPA: hypothetical protein VFR08_06140 [Candidatus Angelobacter sp.]|nr:hypothetical protein [Candidatus Angelobacter sp.]
MPVTVLLFSDWTFSATHLVVPIAVAAAFYFFGRKFPVQAPGELTEEELATPLPGWWTFLSSMLTILIGVSLFLAVVNIARAVNAGWATRPGASTFLLTPSPWWWYLYGGFVALCTAWPIASSILPGFMDKKRWSLWLAQQNQKAGFDGSRAMRWLAYLILVPYTAFFVPSLACYTRFTESEVAIHGYSDRKEARYTYGDVTRIAVVRGGLDRDGKFYSSPRLLMDFRDGTRWTTRDGLRDPAPIDHDLQQFLVLHTGLQPAYVATTEELK